MSAVRIIVLTTLAMPAFAGNSLLCLLRCRIPPSMRPASPVSVYYPERWLLASVAILDGIALVILIRRPG